MKERIQEFCKLGIVHFMMWKDCIKGDGDHSSVKTVLEDPYFDAIELTWINNPETRKKIAAQIRSSGKALTFGAQPVLLTQKLDLNHLEEEHRKKAVSAVLNVIPQSYELGACGFGVLSGKNVVPKRKDEAMNQLIKSLKEISAELKKRGDIPLILETFDQLTYGKNCLIGSSLDAAQIAKEVRKEFPSFGLMIDLSHLPLQRETPRQAWASAGEYVMHAHIGNCIMGKPDHPMNGDEHPPLCDRDGENGIAELAEYLRTLLDNGYLNKKARPFLSFEICIYGSWTRETVLKQSKETLEAAWALI